MNPSPVVTPPQEDDWYTEFLKKLRQTSEDTAKSVAKVSEETAQSVAKVSEETARRVSAAATWASLARERKAMVQQIKGLKGARPGEATAFARELASLEQKAPNDPVGAVSGFRTLQEQVTQTALAIGGVSKLDAPSKGLPGENGPKFLGKMTDALSRCPALQDHFREIFGTGGANVRFSETAKEAFYSSKGDREAGVPDNVITLPKSGEPADLVDGLIFESCNAEIQKDYDALSKKFVTSRNSNPIAVTAFGADKAKTEARAILKDAQLVFALRQSGGESANQGNRNVCAMTKQIMATLVQNGDTTYKFDKEELEEQDAILNDPAKLNAFLEKHSAMLDRVLLNLDKPENEKFRTALVDRIISSQHNRKCTDPTDPKMLTTQEMYAYELMDTSAAQLADIFQTQIKKATGQTGAAELKEVRAWLQDRLSRFDGKNKLARQAMVLKCQGALAKLYPGVRIDLACFAFTPNMEKMAGARYAKAKAENGPELAEAQANEVQKLRDKIAATIQGTTTEIAMAFHTAVPTNFEAALESLQALKAFPNMGAFISQVHELSGSPEGTKLLSEKAAEMMYQAIGEGLGSFNQAIGKLQSNDPKGWAAAHKALVAAVDQLPQGFRDRLRIHLIFLEEAIADL